MNGTVFEPSRTAEIRTPALEVDAGPSWPSPAGVAVLDDTGPTACETSPCSSSLCTPLAVRHLAVHHTMATVARPWAVAALLVVVVFAFAQCWPGPGRRDQADDPDVPGSSSGITAVAYVVNLTVQDASSFDVETVITIRASGAVDNVVINAKQLNVAKKITVYGTDKNGVSVRVPVSDVLLHEDRDEVEILLDKALEVGGTYNVTVTASGALGSPSSRGFIKATFGSENSWLAVVRASPTSARMVFPCVDQPGEEADVSLWVWRPSTHAAIANGVVVNTEDIAGLTKKDTFAKVRLAPHQFGVAVAPLQRHAADGAAVELWGREQAADIAEDVREYVAALDGLAENLSGLPLADSPLSVVALPGVASAAATVGIVALSEEAVLSLHAAAPAAAHRDALLHLAEAVAQPAVRGATRPASWEDAWALRGLAAHLRQRLADQAAAGWRMADQQMALQLQDVLEEGAGTADAALSPAAGSRVGAANPSKGSDGKTREIAAGEPRSAVLAVNPAIAGQHTSLISLTPIYHWAALFRMLEYALNAKVFDSAVRRFYSLSAGKAVAVDDLYDAFSYEAYNGDSGLADGVTVVNVMKSWASKAGYPVVTVMRDYENNVMTVSQKKFSWTSISRRADPESEAGAEWWVPLSYTYALEELNDGDQLLSPRDWLVPGENDMQIELAHLSSDDWVYFNLDQAAPYRVNYDTFNWRLLSRELLDVQFDKTLRPASRAHILGDALALARAGELDYALALDLAAYLRREDDLLPWLVARRSMAFLEDRLQGDGLDWLHQFEALLLKDLYLDSQFGMGGAPQDLDPDVRLLRELVVTWACEAGQQQCLEHADDLYGQWRGAGQPPHADMVEATLCRAVAKYGDDALSFVLTALRDDGLVGGQRRGYVRAAACAGTEQLLRRAVSEAMSATGPFMATEVADLLEAAGSRKPHGWAVVTEYIEKDSATIGQRTGYEGELDRLLLLLASKITSQSQLDQLLVAVAAVQGSEDSELAATIRSEAAALLAWAELHEDEVADWIRVYLNLQPTPSTAATPATAATTALPTDQPTGQPTGQPTAAPASPSPTPSGAGAPFLALWTAMVLAAAAPALRPE